MYRYSIYIGVFILVSLPLWSQQDSGGNAPGDQDVTLDFDGDGQVGFSDFLAFAGRFGARNANIKDLTGLEFATNLTDLNLEDNNLSDVSALSDLTGLEVLNLESNDWSYPILDAVAELIKRESV